MLSAALTADEPDHLRPPHHAARPERSFTTMVLIPLLFHHSLGLPLTIALIVALVGVRVALRRRAARRRAVGRGGSRDRRSITRR
jgi:hypothetical protein